jgi:hypothetical protein
MPRVPWHKTTPWVCEEQPLGVAMTMGPTELPLRYFRLAHGGRQEPLRARLVRFATAPALDFELNRLLKNSERTHPVSNNRIRAAQRLNQSCVLAVSVAASGDFSAA